MNRSLVRLAAVAAAFAAASIGVSGGAPAHAAQSAVLTGPGASVAGFATHVVPVVAGDPITLINADISWHGVRSEAFGSDDRTWCGPPNPGPEGPNNLRRYPVGFCPLFWSDFAAPYGGSRPVLGADLLQSGRAYAFRCTFVPSMRAVVITT